MGTTASMDVLEKRIISFSLRKFRTPDRPVCNLVTISTALSWLNIFALDCILMDLFCDSVGVICSLTVCIALVVDTVLIQLASSL